MWQSRQFFFSSRSLPWVGASTAQRRFANWANVENANVLQNMLTDILTGKKSVQAAASSASSQITSILNAST